MLAVMGISAKAKWPPIPPEELVWMLALLHLQPSSDFTVSDRWTTRRTRHITQDLDHVDTTSVESLSFSVQRADGELTIIASSISERGSASETRAKLVLAFRPTGALASAEPIIDPDAERINRIKWTALETRQGISWSRNWPAIGNLLEAKVTVRPTARTLTDKTVSVTYTENGQTKCLGTIKISTQGEISEKKETEKRKLRRPLWSTNLRNLNDQQRGCSA